MKRLALVILIAALLLLLGGCTRESLKQTVLTPWEKWVKTPVSLPEDEGKIIGEAGKNEEAKGKTTLVALYFVSDGHLQKETKSIPKVEGIARRTLQELFQGPADSSLKSAFPAGTRLNDINLTADGTCVVDLSSEILSLKGQEARKLALAALTSTLGQFPTIEQVKVLVAGEENPDWTGPWRIGDFK